MQRFRDRVPPPRYTPIPTRGLAIGRRLPPKRNEKTRHMKNNGTHLQAEHLSLFIVRAARVTWPLARGSLGFFGPLSAWEAWGLLAFWSFFGREETLQVIGDVTHSWRTRVCCRCAHAVGCVGRWFFLFAIGGVSDTVASRLQLPDTWQPCVCRRRATFC